jgi:hypothetical protein
MLQQWVITLSTFMSRTFAAAIVGLKKGAISTMVRKQAFLQIGSRAVINPKSADPITSNWNQYSRKCH